MNMTESSENKNWIEQAILRESTPKPLREETVEEFAKKWGISSETYFYQMRKKENKKKVVEIWLSEAIEDGNVVLQKLKEKAQSGDNKSIEMYLKFVLELAENLDIKSDGKAIIPLGGFNYVKPASDDSDNQTVAEAGSSVADTP